MPILLRKQVMCSGRPRPGVRPAMSCGSVGSVSKLISFIRFQPLPSSLSGTMRRGVVGMNYHAVGTLDRGGLQFGTLDRGEMHAGLEPALEENVVDGVGGAHD